MSTSGLYTHLGMCTYMHSKNQNNLKTFSRKDTQIASKHIGRYSVSLVIKEMQTKATGTQYFLPSARMGWGDVEKSETLRCC